MTELEYKKRIRELEILNKVYEHILSGNCETTTFLDDAMKLIASAYGGIENVPKHIIDECEKEKRRQK